MAEILTFWRIDLGIDLAVRQIVLFHSWMKRMSSVFSSGFSANISSFVGYLGSCSEALCVFFIICFFFFNDAHRVFVIEFSVHGSQVSF